MAARRKPKNNHNIQATMSLVMENNDGTTSLKTLMTFELTIRSDDSSAAARQLLLAFEDDMIKRFIKFEYKDKP